MTENADVFLCFLKNNSEHKGLKSGQPACSPHSTHQQCSLLTSPESAATASAWCHRSQSTKPGAWGRPQEAWLSTAGKDTWALFQYEDCLARYRLSRYKDKIDALVQERHNFSALAMELRLSCANPSRWSHGCLIFIVVINIMVLYNIFILKKKQKQLRALQQYDKSF